MDILGLLPEILASAIRLSIPLIFACLAGLWSERSGIVDIGLEGKMLAAAFAAASASFVFGSAWIGLLFALATSLCFALVHGYASITHRGNQIISGVAINMLAAGLSLVLGAKWFNEGGRTPALEANERFMPIALPAADALRNVPVIGAIYSGIISNHTLLTYFAFLCVPITAYTLARTRFGLRLRAVGENPLAVDSAGISVAGLRYRAVIICGLLCGFGGAYLSIAQSAGFIKDMTAGKGFIALAALIFANWRAVPAMGACLLFGFLDAAAIRLQGVQLPGIGEVPYQAVQALPYILTVVLLAGFIGKAVPPRASGLPYTKDK